MGSGNSKTKMRNSPETWVSAIKIVERAKGSEAVKDCKRMFKMMGVGSYGTLAECDWKRFMTNCVGWLKDNNMVEKAQMWYEVAQRVSNTKHKSMEANHGIMYDLYDPLSEKLLTNVLTPLQLPNSPTAATAPPPYPENSKKGSCWTCPHCGQQNPLTAGYCVSCGTQRPTRLFPLVSSIHIHRGPKPVDVDGQPVPGAVGEIQSHEATVYRPWSPADLLAVCGTLPDPRKTPSAFHRKLRAVHLAYRATWSDMESLVETKGGEVLKNQIQAAITNPVPANKTNEQSGLEYLNAMQPWVDATQQEQTDSFM
ncbi:uncharacterized protein LOC142670290 [Rhinoderma darwinii]|uniref:uncharacterized protein LOC142670290 n=1 Tax=Rhinoderma darwinii TaxID=43563 RepID=UPI003F6803B8